jgi:DNA-binding GntR family transcriptional regulator
MTSNENKLSHDIFLTLRDRIVYLDYPPETVLSEKELCKEFQVSRTPLREAILRLEEMNLVRSIPRYGTYVTHINVLEIRNTYDVKIHLETLAGILSARRINADGVKRLEELTDDLIEATRERNIRKMFDCDFKFHESIWRSTGNQVLEKMLNNIHACCLRFCMVTIPQSDWSMENADELRSIYKAIRDRDEVKSADLLTLHNRRFINLIKTSSFETDKPSAGVMR